MIYPVFFCFFNVFKILIFWVVSGVSEENVSKWTKNYVALHISGTIYDMVVIYGAPF